MTIVQLQNLSKHYYIGKLEVPALKDISLTIEEGDFVSIAGPSGSGKTTMLNLLGCLDKPSDGRVLIENEDVTELNSNRLADIRNFNIGFIFQTFNLIPVLTAQENVEFPLLLYNKFSKKERKERVLKILDELGILALANRKPNEITTLGVMMKIFFNFCL